ncbi:hypothetical protein ACH0C8_14345, partial [Acetobacter lovaniensis]
MKSTDDRKLFGSPIGASAATGNIAVIPQTQATVGDGTASVALGFPPETFIARAAGGEPPRGQDMNGLLNLLSSATQVLQAGYLGPFDATFAQGIGGYPAGAIVSGATPGTFWVSTADANVSIPGATGATWQSLFNGYATQTWANGQFLQLTNAAVQAVTGPVTFSGITKVPAPTDYTQNQAIGASVADARYVKKTGDLLTGALLAMLVNPSSAAGVTNYGPAWISQADSNTSFSIYSQNTNGGSAAGTLYLRSGANAQYFSCGLNGRIMSGSGTCAFLSDISQTTHSGNAGDAGSFAITVYTDPSTPSGKRYRISGQTAAFTGESRQTISLPLTLNGILPGAWGATTFWNVNTSTTNNDQFAQIIGAPTVSSITVNMAVTADPSLTWPCYATWWV